MSEETKRKDRPGDQKMPVPNDGPSMHDLVLEDLAGRSNSVWAGPGLLMDVVEQRKALGLSRYGTILQAFNDRDALRDALDEAVDLLVYLRQALVEAAAARDESQRHHLAGAYHDATSAALRLAWAKSLRRPS